MTELEYTDFSLPLMESKARSCPKHRTVVVMADHRFTVFSVLLWLLLATAVLPQCSAQENSKSQQTASSDFILSVDPETELKNIVENIAQTINISLVYNGTEPLPSDRIYVVTIAMSNHLILIMENRTVTFSAQDIMDSVNKTVSFTGRVIGYVDLSFKLSLPDSPANEPVVLLEKYLVTVVRATNFWDNMFTIVMTVLAIINTFNMGCGLSLKKVKHTILRPIGPVVGFISQFTFMPLFSFGLAMLLIEDPLKGFGLLVMGVCPGGIGSNFWTLLLDGDVDLSITMTFVSSIAALGMMPLWIWLLSGFFVPEGSVVQVPYRDLAVSLILLTVPIGFGLLARRFARRLADFITNKFIKPFSFCVLVLIFGLGFYSSSHIFILLDWQMCVAGLCVAFAGFFFGAIFAWIMRLSRAQIIAISMETALQNGNIAFILLKLSFGSPYSDIAALPPIAQILMTSCILFVLYFVHKFYVRCRNCGGEDEKNSPDIRELPETEKFLGDLKYLDSGRYQAPLPPSPPPLDDQIPPQYCYVRMSSLVAPNSPTSPVSMKKTFA